MRYIFFILLITVSIQGQILKSQDSIIINKDSLVVDNGSKDSLAVFVPTIKDYQFKTQFGTYQSFDTVFTIDKYYQFTQYNNTDGFGKIPFSNIGAGYQDLVFKVNPQQNLTLLPTNKIYRIKGIEDINYYNVKTPTTAFVYHNGVNNGGALQSTYTQNIGKDFNFAVEYSGLRSKGFYRRSLAANNRFTVSAHYQSPNHKYEAYAHYSHQNINNEENGGITNLDNFLNDSRFKTRENLEVNLSQADSRLYYRRYYYSHQFRPFSSYKFPFKVRHTIFHQGNKYYFNTSTSDAYWKNNGAGNLVNGMPAGSKKYANNLSNTISLLWDDARFKLDAGVRYQNIELGTNNPITPYKEKENRIGAVGHLKMNLWDKLDLDAALELSRGSVFGTYIRSANQLRFEPIKNYFIDAEVNFQSAAPSFNALVNSSPFENFNYNFQDFKNQNVLEIGGTMGLKWFDAQLKAKYFRVDHYTYFTAFGKPKQSENSLNITQLGGSFNLNYAKFYFHPEVLFQTALSNGDLYPMPKLIGRLNLYYQTDAFKKAAEIQTGLNVYYFSKFKSRVYLPMLNEFGLPSSNSYSIGGQPIANAYFNLKVKRMLIYIEGQHFNTTFMKNQSYTAPYYPIADFRLNLGIVWYLFY